jgi:hypothetical protein
MAATVVMAVTSFGVEPAEVVGRVPGVGQDWWGAPALFHGQVEGRPASCSPSCRPPAVVGVADLSTLDTIAALLRLLSRLRAEGNCSPSRQETTG